MKDENTPKILEERLTGTAPKLSKATDQVPLNLVTVKREAPSAFRLDDPGTWPVVVQFLLYPKTLVARRVDDLFYGATDARWL